MAYSQHFKNEIVTEKISEGLLYSERKYYICKILNFFIKHDWMGRICDIKCIFTIDCVKRYLESHFVQGIP